MRTALLVLCLSVAARGQTLERTYDPTRDRTTVKLQLGEVASKADLSATVVFAGTEPPGQLEQAVLILQTFSDQTLFPPNAEFVAVADGRTYKGKGVPIQVRQEVAEGGVKVVVETLGILLPLDAYVSLHHADQGVLKAGPREYVLGEDMKRKMRAVIDLIQVPHETIARAAASGSPAAPAGESTSPAPREAPTDTLTDAQRAAASDYAKRYSDARRTVQGLSRNEAASRLKAKHNQIVKDVCAAHGCGKDDLETWVKAYNASHAAR